MLKEKGFASDFRPILFPHFSPGSNKYILTKRYISRFW